MKLYEINQEYEQILDKLYDDEGMLDQEVLVLLEKNEFAMEKKAIAIACYIKNMDAEREAIEQAKKGMADREKRFKKRIEYLEEYLLAGMERRSISHISCAYFDIKLKKCPPSVDVYDESALPDEYMRIKTETLPDKIKIKEEILLGVVIPGATLKIGMRLDIR